MTSFNLFYLSVLIFVVFNIFDYTNETIKYLVVNISTAVYDKDPRSNIRYFKEDRGEKRIVLYGSNISSTVNYNYLTDFFIPKNLNSIIVGLLLSDGWLQRNKKEKLDSTRLAFKQSMTKFKYFMIVFNSFSLFCSKYPTTAKTQNNKTKKTAEKAHYGANAGIFFVTRSYPSFNIWHDTFYVNNVKRVPLDIYNLLDYEALAHWICGDGNRNGKGIILNTQSFTVQDNVRLISVLIYKFNLKCSLHLQKNQPFIYISSKSVAKVKSKLIIYMHSSMHYKVN